MSAPAYFDTLSDARTRWLEGDPHAWIRYAQSCLQLETELQAAKRAEPSPRCTRCGSCTCEKGEDEARGRGA
jgi:hypothetical protein